MVEFRELVRGVKRSSLLNELYSELSHYNNPVDPEHFEQTLSRRMHEEMGHRYLKDKLIREKRATEVFTPDETLNRWIALFDGKLVPKIPFERRKLQDKWTPQGQVVKRNQRLEEWIAFCFYCHFRNRELLNNQFHAFMDNKPSPSVHLMFIVPSDLEEEVKHQFNKQPVEVIPVPYTTIQLTELAQDLFRNYRPQLNQPSFAKLIAQKNQGRKYLR